MDPCAAAESGENSRVLEILGFLRDADPGVVSIKDLLTNPQNAEWLAIVRYEDGSEGFIEGVGLEVIRQTLSPEYAEFLAVFDPEVAFRGLLR